MIGKLLKAFFKTGKTATKSVGKSMDFIDDILEKEYLTNAVDNLRTSSGQVIEKAGKAYQQTIDTVDKNIDLNKVKAFGEDVLSKGKGAADNLTDKIQEKAKDLKDIYNESMTIKEDRSEEE